jgi:hypothetical protein
MTGRTDLLISATYLRPPQASAYLAERWAIRATPKTLAKWRVIGGGPRYRRASRDILYEPGVLDAWASTRISARDYSNTAEAEVA